MTARALAGRFVACVVALALLVLPAGARDARAEAAPSQADGYAYSANPGADAVSGTPLGPSGADGLLPAGLDPATARRTTITRLASADEGLNNSLVTFRGEAVGEAVASSSPGYRWVLLQSHTSDTTSSIEVLMTLDQVGQIARFGSYRVKGTTVEVTGIYRVADPSQTGMLDVTAYNVRALDEGGELDADVSLPRLWAGLALAALGLALGGVNRYLRRRSLS